VKNKAVMEYGFTDHRSCTLYIGKSIMKIGNVTALTSVYGDHLTDTPRTRITSPKQIVGTNTTFLKASIHNIADYYQIFSIFLYL